MREHHPKERHDHQVLRRAARGDATLPTPTLSALVSSLPYSDKDLDDNDVNRFSLWGGNVESEDLTQAYLDYLIEAEQSDGSPNEAFITAMQTQDFSTFTPGLGCDDSRIPII